MTSLTFNMLTAVLLILFALEVTVNAKADDGEELTKLGQGAVSHTMNIFYCYSCGYRKVFDDYAGIIKQKYPEINVVGDNYEPPGISMYLSRFIAYSKMIVILMIVSRINILGFLNKPEPSWWTWCLENKLYACMMVFFLSNMVEGHLMSSGAFEISLNGIPLWSKLETGRIPQPPELFQIIDNLLRMSRNGMPNKFDN